ncbi:mitotic checkpoint protein BUB3.3 isoform X2 [Magnolia sinica]|uniref:mitotic checkpoint protein BUB3.3 isoform X2 n=1 Tax=Magnolia sinica TaxID=86752 RepID=UPI0026580308|nr:mitotic checkpoint protein BUB3.3 isoform X2 [Magnolia sinica]XP_058080499.1 mitotic checkpoint protein BUB3.3 isoform X2 [Magnolia sinica]
MATSLNLEVPLGDAISRIHFAPRSNNLLFSSWDSILRLYDVDSSVLRFEAPSEAALLNCCFEDESSAFSVGSDCCIRRYDLCSGIQNVVGKHDDLATCIEYSQETAQVITAGLDKKIMFWDMQMANCNVGYSKTVDAEVESISLSGLHLLVATGTTVNMYDLRNLNGPVQMKESIDYRITRICSFPNYQGYAIGSIEGRVALKFFDSSAECEMGYVFRCCPKAKDGKYHLVAINDLAFHPRYGTFVTGDNEGYTIIWDGQSRKRLLELPRHPSSVASLSFNGTGQLLAVASSYTYQEENEMLSSHRVYLMHVSDVPCKW